MPLAIMDEREAGPFSGVSIEASQAVAGIKIAASEQDPAKQGTSRAPASPAPCPKASRA